MTTWAHPTPGQIARVNQGPNSRSPGATRDPNDKSQPYRHRNANDNQCRGTQCRENHATNQTSTSGPATRRE
ncbi:hypothetical protein N7541_010963 [Penicillium brevicompactum]|uniref:Uncharacterized protein n=1 Tax=Penicillium brevicompactum TaxID=5074 RepID=A0A9W9UIP9_PENBR|nr:hypothetical protein N7541_010963 [Penicillium brevicompactum]